MSRQLEQIIEERARKRQVRIVRAVEFELADELSRGNCELQGLAVKLRRGDCLMTVKVSLAGKRQVAFVGAEDFGACLIKAVAEAKAERLRWREDRYGGES